LGLLKPNTIFINLRMSKRDLKKYLENLDAQQIAEQILDLYDKFGDVKTYYDFVFNPKEDKLLGEAKAKIANEYFPIKTKRAKLRRSTAQKYIKHFVTLGVDANAIADLMLFNIETAQKYSAKREMRYSSFYKSMLNSFEQAANFIVANGILPEFKKRLSAIETESARQRWENQSEFKRIIESFEWQ
jgi:hypothetical protein